MGFIRMGRILCSLLRGLAISDKHLMQTLAAVFSNIIFIYAFIKLCYYISVYLFIILVCLFVILETYNEKYRLTINLNLVNRFCFVSAKEKFPFSDSIRVI